VTLPFALLLLDYWPLGRLGFARKSTNVVDGTAVFFRRCTEKLPLLLLAAGSAILTLKAQALDTESRLCPGRQD